MSAAGGTTGAGERPPLSRERILEAAVAIADAEGIAALSMRRLGADLGVEAMSLYHHVRNKDALLEGMLDTVAARFELPDASLPWREAVRRQAVSAHSTLMRHPWAVPMWTARRDPGPPYLRAIEHLLATLERAGLGPVLLDRAFHAIENHVVGFTMQAVTFLGALDDGTDLRTTIEAFLAGLDHDGYPHLAAHVRHHLGDDAESEQDAFTFGLDLVLDGIERLRT